MPTFHCCRMSLQGSLGSDPSWSELPPSTGRNWVLNPSLGKSTWCKRVAGGVASPSLPLPVFFPCMGKEVWKTPLSVTRCASVSKTLRMGFPATPNAIICQDLISLETLKVSLRTGSTASSAGVEQVNNRAAGRKPKTLCTAPNLWDISQNQLETQHSKGSQAKTTTEYSKTH